MPKAKLTNPRVEKLKADPTKQLIWRDTEFLCLALEITPNGKKSWKLVGEYKGNTIRCKIADWPGLDREAAYWGWVDADGDQRPGAHQASQYMRGAKGKHPAQLLKGKTNGAFTLRTAMDSYFVVRKRLKEKTKDDYKKQCKRHLEDWMDRPLNEITEVMVEQRHQKIRADIERRKATPLANGNSSANGTMRIFRAFWNHAEGRDLSLQGQRNPVKRLSTDKAWYPERRRRGRVRKDQFPDFYNAVGAHRHDGSDPTVGRDYVLYVLFTGMRRNEAARLRWDGEVDFVERFIRLGEWRTKADRCFDLPMSDFVYDLLVARRALGHQSEYVFPSPGKRGVPYAEPRTILDKVAEECSVDVTVHDLRRTFESVANSCRLTQYELKGLLNHALPKDDVTAGYIEPDDHWLRLPVAVVTDKLKELCGITQPEGENVEQLNTA